MNFDSYHFRTTYKISPRDADRSNLLGRCGNWLNLTMKVSQHKDPIDSLMCLYVISEEEAKAIFDDFIAEMHGEDKSDA